MKKLIPILVLVAAGGIVWYALRGTGKGPDNRLMISGNIELDEVNIAFKTAGRLTERAVDEGDGVKKGQVVARLDRDQLLAQRDRETAGLASSESQLAQAQTAVEFQRASLAADIETRNADLASTEARLAEMRNGARPQEKLDAKAAVEAAASEVERKERLGSRANAAARTTIFQPRSSINTATATSAQAYGSRRRNGIAHAGRSGWSRWRSARRRSGRADR